MQYGGGFRASGFPRYVGESAMGGLLDDAQAQDAAWNALQIAAIAERGISLEVRMVCAPSNRSISVFVLCASRPDNPISPEDLGLIQQLLPSRYLWTPLAAQELAPLVVPSSGPRATWRLARIHRRVQYMDLPRFLQLDDEAGSTAERPMPQPEPLDGRGLRRLPTNPYTFRAKRLSERFCVPLLESLEDRQSDRRELYEAMQLAAPAIVSVALHPFPAALLERDRQVATRLRGPLEYIGQRLAVSGFGDVDASRRVYDRYFLPDGYVGLMTMRVAASTTAAAVAVAHQACSWLGGMRVFRVLPPHVDFDTERLAGVLADPELEYPQNEDDPESWTGAQARLQRELDAESIAHGIGATNDPPADRPVALTTGGEWDPRYERFLVRLRHAYTLEETARMLRLPYGLEGGLPGVETRLLPPFHPAAQRYDPILAADGSYRAPTPGRIRIGRVNPGSTSPADPAADAGLHWLSIPVEDLSKHMLIVGSTGSGKTTTMTFSLLELQREKIPFLVVEPVKTEYFDNLSRFGIGPTRWRFEGTPDGREGSDYLYFDPMRLQTGVSVARHVSYLKSCFEAAFPMEAWQSLLLENALRAYYLEAPATGGCGFELFQRGSPPTIDVREGRVFPSFATFKDFLVDVFLERELKLPGGGRSSAAADLLESNRQVFRRRFENLSGGPLGRAFARADRTTLADFAKATSGQTQRVPRTAHFEYLLRGPTVVELDAVPDGEHKALIMAFLLTFLFERRQADDLLAREQRADERRRQSALRHVIVVEEAHRLLASVAATSQRGGDNIGLDSRAKAVALFVDMLAEMRALGEGVVIVEQIPTKLVPEAVKNTNVKIMCRLTAGDDRDYLGGAMSFNEAQKQFVNSLRAEAGVQVQFVAFAETVDQPELLSLPLTIGARGGLFDQYFSAPDEEHTT